jgi:glycosyltransferase 2 family protein
MISKTDPTSGASPKRSLLMSVAKAAVSVALLFLLFTRVDINRLWQVARQASPSWLIAALALYLGMTLTCTWRWSLLLKAQHLDFRFRSLTASFLVANFFNNFLPSNIGGDVVRIADTAPVARSRTLATTVVLLDRGVGLLALVLVAALGSTLNPRFGDRHTLGAGILWIGFAIATTFAIAAVRFPHAFARLAHPLRRLHAEWVDERLARFTATLSRFQETPGALAGCFVGAVAVQAAIVAFYAAIAHSMRIPVGFAELAVIVPVTLIVQMLPVSMNGFGVREATFGFYFTRLGLPLESALVVSFMGAALILLFSLSGGVTYLARHAGRAQAGFGGVLAEE